MYCFGGYQGGERVNTLSKFEPGSQTIPFTKISSGGENDPSCRAGASICIDAAGSTLIMFGGQEEDNKKLNDVWIAETNCEGDVWTKYPISEESYNIAPRCGHSAVMHNGKMYIFGGLYELTHELNDLVAFELSTRTFVKIDGDEVVQHEEENAGPEQTSPEGRSKQDGTSPAINKKKTFAASSTRSPSKKMGSPSRMKAKANDETDGGNKEGVLSSPTSVSMKNTFIIKNADESFEINSKLIPKVKGQKSMNMEQPPKQTNFVDGTRPTPRDGHSCVVDSAGNMYVFGGDRHHMPFNDLYMIRLE